MENIIKRHLGLSHVSIISIETHPDDSIEITVKSTLKEAQCHRCNQVITRFYDHDRLLRLRHLPILGQRVFIKVRLPRYQCDRCDKKPKTTQRPEWHKKNSSFTVPYEEQVLLSAINSTETDVGHKEGLTEEQVKGIVNRYIGQRVDWETVDSLPVLGIDEISLRKGHQSFIVVITCKNQGCLRLIALLSSRKKEAVKAFLNTIPEHLRATLRWVCTDMYEGYINASKEALGQRIKVVVDRFHVAKLYRKQLDTLRKQELKRLKRCLSVGEYRLLKGAMWALRRAPQDLTDHDKQVIDRLFRQSGALEEAYHFCAQLTQLFDEAVSRASGVRRLKSWIRQVEASTLTCFSTFIKTLRHHFDEIAHYFISRQSSGFVEGLNNKIKVIKRRCYGIFRLDHLFQRITLDIQGYAMLR